MGDLKKELLREEKMLEACLGCVRDRLKNAPEGSLYISRSGKTVQYYHGTPGKGKGKYIPVSQINLARGLAQKSYDKKIFLLAEKRLSQIKNILRNYADDEIDLIYEREGKEKQKLITPVKSTWEQTREKWISEDYVKKGFYDNAPLIITEKGERVRSKSEKILADYFYRRGIPYKYECPLRLENFGMVHPDFTFLSKKLGKEIYWEHDGRMDDQTYAQNAVKKLHAYEKNNIYPGERLILTFETEKSVLDMQLVEGLVNRYLL